MRNFRHEDMVNDSRPGCFLWLLIALVLGSIFSHW